MAARKTVLADPSFRCSLHAAGTVEQPRTNNGSTRHSLPNSVGSVSFGRVCGYALFRSKPASVCKSRACHAVQPFLSETQIRAKNS